MQKNGIRNYRHKRRTLVTCHNRADGAATPQKEQWIAWPDQHKVHIGMALLDLFIEFTGLVKRSMQRAGGKTSYWIEGTDEAIAMIQANKDVFQFMHPEFLPTLIPPVDWTTPFNGGYHSHDVRRRKPLVKSKAFSRKRHRKALVEASMPEVYEAVNAAQATKWRVNEFVLQQAGPELEAGGIGCPSGLNQPAPESPYPLPDQGGLSDSEYAAVIGIVRAERTPDEIAELTVWRGKMKDWHHQRISGKAKMLGLYNTYKIARLLSCHEEFYYVHTFDSRSRLYPCGVHLSPQGTGLSKGLLEFVNATPLGQHGYWHLCQHAAGVFDVPAVSLEARVAWIHEHAQRIIDTWADPAATREFWGSADKPYMFLAACKELAEIWMMHGQHVLTIVNKSELTGVASSYESHLPCGLDGSCNGIQHFSAMLLDPVGAVAVNMTAGRTKQDLYNETAKVAEELLREHLRLGIVLDGGDTKAATADDVRFMRLWLSTLKVDRKVCKRSTMIIPYGGQKSSCKADVLEVLVERLESFDQVGQSLGLTSNEAFSAGYLLHHYVWKALDTVVVAARKAMKFLSRCATAQAKSNLPMQWTTPVGFPCFQDYKRTKPKTVETVLSGRMQVTYSVDIDELDVWDMRSAFPPNFVHSMDATHMMLTVNAALDCGITDFALVHDSYGVPAGHCEAMHRCIRAEFVKMYTEDRLYNLLNELQQTYPGLQERWPSVADVERGSFDLTEVLDAPFFFAS
jgi:DNA-directed RNA polymerase